MLRRKLLYGLGTLGIGLFAKIMPTLGVVRCSLCAKEITGKYKTYRNKYKSMNVCLSCDRTKPRCDACNLPHHSQQLRSYRGERLCSVCIRISKYCSLCDDRIKGVYYKSKNGEELFCQRCYHNSPRCKVCNMPTRPNLIDKESGACWRCLPKLKRCAACNKAITGEYYTFKYSDEYYCSECKHNRAKCYTCGVPVGENYWKFPDGRSICDKCHKKVIIDAKEITKIMEDAERLVRKYVGLDVQRPYKLHIRQRNNISEEQADLAKREGGKDSPLFGDELGLYRYKDGQSEIFLLYGVPREMLYETAAHEFAHAWQAENCPHTQSMELKEGFAQWVAAQVLRSKGYKIALEKLEDRHDRPYGTGYHLIKDLYKKMGRARLLDYLKNKH